jgi:chorismate mutase
MEPDTKDPSQKLQEARSDIQQIDAKIVGLLKKRLEAAQQAGEAKKAMGRDLEDSSREQRHMDYLHYVSELPPDMLTNVFDSIMTHTLLEQAKKLNPVG